MTDADIGETENPEFKMWPLIEELKKSQIEASKDPLTGLLNRRGLMEEAYHVLSRDRNFGCILFDIDHFKMINDQYGHSVGDKVIQQTAQIIKNQIRGMDLAVRYGGEEFMIIVPDAKNTKTAEDIVHRLQSDLNLSEIANPTGGSPVQWTCSFGISQGIGFMGSEGLDPTIHKADMAMYKAKEGGRNRVVVYKEEG